MSRTQLVDMQRVATNLYLARIAAGMTQSEASEAAGVSNSQLSYVESMRHRPSEELISRLAKLYRVRQQDLLHRRAVISWEDA